MAESARCPQCGTELPEDAPQGLCPACLLKLGLSGAVPVFQEPSSSPPRRRERLIAIAAILGAVIIAAALLVPRRPAPRSFVVRFSIPVPEDAGFAVSPDGAQLAYSASGRLWLRRLDAFAARELSGGEGASAPFWSPDSHYIGFASAGKLKKIAVDGGPAQIVCDAPRFTGGSWNRDDYILFGDGRMLYRVPAAGGGRQRLLELDGSRQEVVHRWPQLLPDPKRFLFSVTSRRKEASGIYAGDSVRRTEVLPGSSMAAEADGYLLALRDGILMAYPFDVARLQVHGDSQPIRFAVQVRSFSVSATTLAYRSGPDPQAQLTWFDRNGRRESVGRPTENGPMSISPDGKKVVIARMSGVWLLDLTRDVSIRLTFGDGWPTSAVWSADGAQIAFGMEKPDGSNILRMPVNGAGEPETMFSSNEKLAADSWSGDGRVILYEDEDTSGKSAIWELPIEPKTKPKPVLRSDFRVRSARLSPNGRWMAYVSNESGRDEVYVQTFPRPGGKWIISAAGGAEPSWRNDGKELFFLSADHVLMAVQVDTGLQVLRVGVPRSLFHTRKAEYYTASADGSRFLVADTPEDVEPPSIGVVLNWAEDLRR